MEKMKVLSKTRKNSVEKYKTLMQNEIKELTDKYTINIEKLKKNVTSAKTKVDKLEAFALFDVTKNLFANDKIIISLKYKNILKTIGDSCKAQDISKLDEQIKTAEANFNSDKALTEHYENLIKMLGEKITDCATKNKVFFKGKCVI